MATFADVHHEDNCAICLERFVDPYKLECTHTFCRDCINQYKKHGVNDVCPFCRSPLPPGVEESVDQCHKMTARSQWYTLEGSPKKIAITPRLQLHHAETAVRADPKHALARFYLAVGLELVSQDTEGAIREYREAIRCDPNNAVFRGNLGVMLYNVRKDYDGAEREYREAIRCDPNNAIAHSNLGNLLYTKRKDYNGAEREYREVIRCDPNYANGHFNLGVLLNNERNDYDGADYEFRDALRCDPSHAGALEARAPVSAARRVQS